MNIKLFNETCDKVINSEINTNGPIGTLGEKTVHSVVKNYVEPDSSSHEIKIESFYADIINDKGIIEIQNGNFDKLRKKLKVLLELQPVTIVYPICHVKTIYWINDKTGEVSKPRKSTRTGNPYLLFRELYKIKNYLHHPNIKFHIILMDMDEYRLLDGWSKDKKRGATKCDRIPTKLVDEIHINSIDDYSLFLPEKLASTFTVRDYKAATNTQQRDAGVAVHILTYVGAIKKVGEKGRAYLYTPQ